MQTITTHQLIGLTSTTYTVQHTDAGRTIGTYFQDHGADVVTSPELPADDDGVIGPIEAIAYFAEVAGLRGYRLSEDAGQITCAEDLLHEVDQRAATKGGFDKCKVKDIWNWSQQLRVSATHVLRAMMQIEGDQREAVAA